LTAFELHHFLKNNWEKRKMQEFIKEDFEREQAANTFKTH